VLKSSVVFSCADLEDAAPLAGQILEFRDRATRIRESTALVLNELDEA
jgi:hypothetical protein